MPAKDAWGFIDGDNTVWQYYEGDLCRVVDYTSAGVEYAIYRTNTKRNSQPEVYYIPGYSRTLDSRIDCTWSKAMEDIPLGYVLRKKKR